MTIRKTLKSNEKIETISMLYEAYKSNKKDIYKRVAQILEKSVRKNISVNISKLEKLSVVKEGYTIVVPGKVLGARSISKKLNVYAYKFSNDAQEKLSSAKSLNDFCKDKLDYKKTLIII